MRAVAGLLGQQGQKGKSRLKGDQLFDIICVGIFLVTVLFLRHLNAGAIYFWIKDLTQEFLKLQVIYTAVELFDKVSSPYHCGCFDCLAQAFDAQISMSSLLVSLVRFVLSFTLKV